jgi:hypothetical protein
MLERQLENVVRRLEAQSYELALPTPTGDRERMLARAAPAIPEHTRASHPAVSGSRLDQS